MGRFGWYWEDDFAGAPEKWLAYREGVVYSCEKTRRTDADGGGGEVSALSFNPNCGACGGLNSRGYCQYTACRFPVSKETVITKAVSGSIIKNLFTKFDLIRSMDVDQLAKFLCETVSPKGTVNCGTCPAQEYCRVGHNGWIDWLNLEASE